MPRKCFVPGCCSNYKGTDYVTAFRFPKDDVKREIWIKKIPRSDRLPHKDSVVCEKHFADKFIVRYDELPSSNSTSIKVLRGKPKLTDDAYPSIFPNLPSYLTTIPVKRCTNPEKRAKTLEDRFEAQFQSDLEDLYKKTKLDSFDDLIKLIEEEGDMCEGWITVKNADKIEFLFLEHSVLPPVLKAYVCINFDLYYSAYVDGLKISSKKLQLLDSERLTSVDEIRHILVVIKNQISSSGTDINEADCLLKSVLSALHKIVTLYQDASDDLSDKTSAVLFFSEQLNLLSLPPN